MNPVRLATGVVDGLRAQPLALALVVINILYLAAGGYLTIKVLARTEAIVEGRDKLITQLIESCGLRERR